jgi:hypothetical protein
MRAVAGIADNADLGLVSGPLPADDVGINIDRSTAMHHRHPQLGDPVAPLTADELRARLTQHAIEAQSAELQRELRRLELAAVEERRKPGRKSDAK